MLAIRFPPSTPSVSLPKMTGGENVKEMLVGWDNDEITLQLPWLAKETQVEEQAIDFFSSQNRIRWWEKRTKLRMPSLLSFFPGSIPHCCNPFFLILLSPHSEAREGWGVGIAVILGSCHSTFLTFLPLLQHGILHGGYRLSWPAPSHGQQFFMTAAVWALICLGLLLLSASALPCVPRGCSLLLCASLHLLSPGTLQGLRVDLLPCGPTGAQQRKHIKKETREEPLLQVIDCICWLCQVFV